MNMINKLKKASKIIGTPNTKRLHKIVFECLKYSARLGLSPGEYFTYGFHKKSINQLDVSSYLTNSTHFTSHLNKLNGIEAKILSDKKKFKNVMTELNVRIPKSFALIDEKYASSLLGEKGDDFFYQLNANLIGANSKAFIAKPSFGSQGKGIHLVKLNINSKKPYEIDGKKLDKFEFLSFMFTNCSVKNEETVILEEYIEANNLLTEISPNATPNIRIVTLKTQSGSVLISSASMRLGVGNVVTSNASSGGLLAKIDINTGQIEKVRTNFQMDGNYIESHPTTGRKIVGIKVPMWDRVVETCMDAAKKVSFANSIGWDVLVGTNDIYIIEANGDWDVVSEQLFGQGYLSKENRAALESWGINYPVETLPKIEIKNLRNAFLGI